MKRLLLLIMMAGFIATYAQNTQNNFKSAPAKAPVDCINETSNPSGQFDQNRIKTLPPIPPSANRDINVVNPIAIGEAGNAFGFAFMRTTYLWADNNINSISFIHRMLNPPGTGFLAYDISKDGGLTWENNIQVYDPTLTDAYNGRYPQGALYNPVGNTDPDNAYFHYFAPTLDNTNPGGVDWGGYAYGVKQLANGATPTQHNRPSTPPFYQYLPSGFTITQDGVAWMTDEENQGDGSSYTYTGNLIIGQGLFNDDTQDYDYTFDHFPLEIHPDDGINDVKIAFAPDGQTGWICVLSNLPDLLPYTSYHPIFFKTEDGGESWDDPIEVQLGGEDGLEAIKQFISDENLEAFYDPNPVPPRDEIDYYIGYYMDIAVDAWGNPHISGMVCIADNKSGSIWPNEGLMAMFHIWSNDQGETWEAFNLGDLKRFRAEFSNGGSTVTQFNRPQVATTMDGGIVFFTWLDTHLEGVEDNSAPDIFFREYLPTLDIHGEEIVNVTEFSAAMWSSTFGCMSHYVFSEETETDYTYTIPMVYEILDNGDPLAPVEFYYIPDFIRSYTITDIRPNDVNPVASVSQNYPNPFAGQTSIKVNLLAGSQLEMQIHDLTGQLVKTLSFGKVAHGLHRLDIDASDLNAGIYFYTLSDGSNRITKKMIIQ